MRVAFACLLGMLLVACGQQNVYLSKISKEQQQRTADFINPDRSPLDTGEISRFKGLHFYEPDETYHVDAKLIWLPQVSYLNLPHSGGDTLPYMQTAIVQFELEGQPFELEGYQNDEMKAQHILFLPFTDLSNQNETYGGGRYLDIAYVDNHNTIEIDFNLAYAPFCAHSERYSCPKVPKNNHLPLAIKAGEKL